MRFLASPRWRLFLVAWALYSVHFATNVVREHYPAFSIAEHGTFRVDEYQGLHSDIFVHTDGHSYVGNNVIVSVMAAVPLLVFDPVLDALEAYSKRKLAAADAAPEAEYHTDRPMRRAFFRLVKKRGLDLRFGAATFITSVFFMAPFSAACVVLMFHLLLARGVPRPDATWLALLFGFGTPVFFRTAHLNHNMFLMYALFAAFVVLWRRDDHEQPLSLRRRLVAGFLGGFCFAADYMGLLLLGLLYGYLVLDRLRQAGLRRSISESMAFVAGSIPPVLFLWYSQWAMYGNPFYPGQHWMPDVNFANVGMRGIDWPSPDLFWFNLFDPAYGMYVFGPLLLLGLVPAVRRGARDLILPRAERRFVVALMLVVMLFCAANQYSRMQFNSGFRYLVPLVPFIFLQLSDHLRRWPWRWRIALSVPVFLHSWVITVYREPVGVAWQRFLHEGLTLPWLWVAAATSAFGWSGRGQWLFAAGVLLVTGLFCLGVWRLGARAERRLAAAEG